MKISKAIILAQDALYIRHNRRFVISVSYFEPSKSFGVFGREDGTDVETTIYLGKTVTSAIKKLIEEESEK